MATLSMVSSTGKDTVAVLLLDALYSHFGPHHIKIWFTSGY